jgi:hypothetical protein
MSLSRGSVFGALSVLALTALSSSALASTQYYVWKSEPGTYTRKPGVNSFQIPLVSSEYRRTSTLVQVDNQVITQYVCPSSASRSGSSNNWNGYFNIKDADKPGALEATIAGLNDYTAAQLVKNKAFPHKPRTWGDFVDMIEDQNEAIPGLYYSVVIENGKLNRSKLGYGSYDSEDCTLRTTTKPVYQEQPVDIATGETRTYTVYVNVQGGALLPQEWEIWSARFKGGRAWIDAPTGFEGRAAFNTYSFEDQTEPTRDARTVIATGTRQRVNPLAKLKVFAKPQGDSIELEITDENFVYEQNAERVVYITGYQRKPISFSGTTITLNKDPKQVTLQPGTWTKVETGLKVNMSQNSAKTGATKNDVIGFTKLRIQYKNSAYYNEEVSLEDVSSSDADFGPARK